MGNCKLFVWRIITWSYDYLLRIIIISYLKPFHSEQTKDYYLREMIIWNHIAISIM